MRSRPLAALAGLLAATTACGDLARALGECGTDQAAYQEAIADDGALLSAVPSEGPYPMALVISQPAINELLQKTSQISLDPIRETHDWGRLRVTPTFPVLSIQELADCPTCILADLSLDLWLDVEGAGTFDGSVAVQAGVPLLLGAVSDRETDVIAGLGQVVIAGLNVTVEGFDTSEIPELNGILAGLAQDFLRDEFGDKTLTRLDSFQVGQGDVFLAGRGLRIFPEQKTLLLGLHTNLVLPPATTLAEQATLPEGTDLSLQFHPGLLLSMGERLLFEGEIPRDYDQEGNAADGGDDHVLLRTMDASDAGALHTVFRVWRTGGGGCGFVDVASDLSLALTGGQITIAADNLEVVEGEGAGAFLAEADWLAGDFLQAFTDNLELTVNYREMSVGDSEEDAQVAASGLFVDGRGLTVHLDLL